jgi:3-hydroxybutyryl-CoA dehydrogenase
MTGASIQRVGVIGAGVMGTGAAQALAQAGCSVVLLDLNEAILDRARTAIREAARFHHLVYRGQPALNADEIIGRIRFTTDRAPLGRVEFVIENVTERWADKEPIYRMLDEVCPPACVLAANTSAIPITQIAGATKRPSQVVGMHFMNPVPVKPTVEVIRGYHTSADTLQTALALLEKMGKKGIVVNDSPGFVSNRVLMLAINEAVCLLHENVAAAEDIDRIFKECLGHKMGPLETADLIGLDTILLSLEVLFEQFQDPKFRPSPLLRKLVAAGLHGRKTGQGVYSYS